ncbi:hypothetical protein PN36_12945 [Candidatus Thiomargarita nelsonii]|uniref:Protein-glutamine gamma-glutamyltransferase-like C-terminal domain-containing protein n=1 Tax=Candidatus Thiomargarita nelsonii TaxID=1003181 RepID=A0A0A6RY13_9GAMM|nr:hypothetical protein PN36_12945 [Candidatus Thiomargarita nelsonii]
MKIYISLLIVYLSISSTVLATVDPKMAKQYIADILSQPEFKNTREEYRLKYIGEFSFKEGTEETLKEGAQETLKEGTEETLKEGTQETLKPRTLENIGLAQVFELLLWILLAVGLIRVIIYVSPWLEQLRPADKTTNPRLLDKEVKKAQMSLPNISQQAWTFWQTGASRTAISLLYRGALSVLNTRNSLNIDDSATDSECLRRVKQTQAIELMNYFTGLTRVWQNIAYAGRLPTELEVQQLCQEWQVYFGHPR